jgi:hypothetical protein
MTGKIALMLIYEPASGAASIPLATITDTVLSRAVGRRAVQLALRRARMATAANPAIGREEYNEAARLGDILSVLMPAA